MIELNRIQLEDIFTCDPISKRGRGALNRVARINNIQSSQLMDINDFYESIYVEPYFNDIKSGNKNNTPAEEYKFEDFIFSAKAINKQNLMDLKTTFENKIYSHNSDYLLFIRASAGSGKSIYLNWLKRERRKLYTPSCINIEMKSGLNESANELNFDLESAPSSIMHGAIEFPSAEYAILNDRHTDIDSPWNFFIMIIDTITEVCLNIVNDEYIDRKMMENNFHIVYGANYEDSIENLYEALFDDNLRTVQERKKKTKIFKLVINACFVNNYEPYECIKKSLSILCRLYIIKTDISIPKQLLISFDNIEHFINNKKRVYDEDIRKITSAVINFANDENIYLDKIGVNFAEFFKILLVVRDTTSKMLSSDVHDRWSREDSSINITGWFSLENIYSNKLNHFLIETSNSISLEFFKLIIEDENRKNDNIMQQISNMYNHNNRRITRILTRIAGSFELMQGIETCDIVNSDIFYKIWQWKESRNTKYLCRQAILRLIYNQISATGFFENICMESTNREIRTFAMRVLTWLANKNSHATETYFNYYDIMKNIICNPAIRDNCTISDERLKNFANILISLDEHRFESNVDNQQAKLCSAPNRWCQLIIIKHNSIDTDDSNRSNLIVETMKNEYLNKGMNSGDYGIRLTEAGYFLAQVISSYEFISCLSSNGDLPLVFMTNVEKIKNVIASVYENAKELINCSLLFESNHFNGEYSSAYDNLYHLKYILKDGIEYRTIAYRIYQEHRAYLMAYKKYLEDDILQNTLGIFTPEKITNLCNFIDNQIQKYQDDYTDLKDNKYVITESKHSESMRIDNYIPHMSCPRID